ncbi:hypothetical protein [Edaphobacter aggregans]|uniref:hypothetical protein n=1 Tax=Edaphobacter aggregans TaxID=570835 RepID=UPI00054CF2B1|nr:hypothetical protein [Edaphobacter aggregans]
MVDISHHAAEGAEDERRSARVALQKDYESMVEEGLFLNDPLPFSELMARCSNLEEEINNRERT